MAGGKIKRRKNIVDEYSSRITELMAQVLPPGGDGDHAFVSLCWIFRCNFSFPPSYPGVLCTVVVRI